MQASMLSLPTTIVNTIKPLLMQPEQDVEMYDDDVIMKDGRRWGDLTATEKECATRVAKYAGSLPTLSAEEEAQASDRQPISRHEGQVRY